MHKFYRSVLLTGMVAVGLAGCGDDVTIVEPPPPPPPPPPTVHSITVAPNPANILVGQSVSMAAAVVADPEVATTVTWTTSNATVASVSATGVVTGNAAGSVAITATSTAVPSVSGVATVNVAPQPTATVTSVTVTPGNASINVGQTVQLSASVQGTNNPDQLVTWTSLSESIATVSAGGLVTGVANGTAVIRGCSTVPGFTNVCGSMSVVVSTPNPAVVSLQGLFVGMTNTPVNLNNVFGQIEASVNVDAGDQVLDRVDVLIGGIPVASQSFGVSPAAGEDGAAGAPVVIVLSFNTTQLRKINDIFIPVIFNGQKVATANLYVAGSSTPIASNAIPIVMNNPDQAIAPASLDTDPGALSHANGGITWFKSGLSTSFTYLAYSTIDPTSVVATLSGGCGTATGTMTGTHDTGLIVDRNWTCAGTEAQRSITGVGAVTYPVGAVGPDGSVIVAAAAFSTVGGQFDVAGDARWNLITPTPNALPGPVAVDNLGPATQIANNANPDPKTVVAFNAMFDQWWINHNYTFTAEIDVDLPGGTQTADAYALDNGSGTASVVFREFTTSCSATVVTDGDDFAETVTSINIDGKRICAVATDNLGNTSTTGASNYFGVDKVAPSIRLAGTTAATPALVGTPASVSATPNTSIYSIAAPFVATDVWGLEGLDGRSGFNQNAVAGYPSVQTMDFLAPTGTLACTFTNPPVHTNQLLGVSLSDTWVRTNVEVPLDCGIGLPGYFWWNGHLVDRAGNPSADLARNFAIDQYAIPNITGLGFASAFYTPGAAAPFGFSANDDLEIIDGTLFVAQGIITAGDGLRYPLGSLTALGTRWDMTLTNVLNGAVASIPYFIFRVDEMCGAATDPYASCPDPAGAAYNLDAHPYITTAKLDPLMGGGDPTEYNDVNGTDAGQLPTAVSANVGDVASQLAGAAINAPMLVSQFNPAAGIAEPWSTSGVVSWSIVSITGGTVTARHVDISSVVVPYFDNATLWRQNVNDEWVLCGEFPAQARSDNGFHRFWTYTMAVPAVGDACHDATTTHGAWVAPAEWRAGGTKNGALLMTPTFTP